MLIPLALVIDVLMHGDRCSNASHSSERAIDASSSDVSLLQCMFELRCIFDIYISININFHIYYASSYDVSVDVVLFNLKCIVCMLMIYTKS